MHLTRGLRRQMRRSHRLLETCPRRLTVGLLENYDICVLEEPIDIGLSRDARATAKTDCLASR
jgi:hypothetical protein